MNIGINADYFWQRRNGEKSRTVEEKIKLCVDGGFRVFDCTPDVSNENYESHVYEIMNAAAKYGATVEQSHVPFNFYAKRSPEIYAKILDRSIDAAIKMGIKNLVFHADEYHPTEDAPWNPDVALQQIYDLLAPYIEKLNKGGVNAALETLFEDKTMKPIEGERTHFCADVDELIAIIDKFNDKMVGCCWDFGHAKLSLGNAKHADAIRRMGSRIICTHVHDNLGHRDAHLQPFMGDANWEQLMPALKDAGYKGSLSLEMVYGCMHPELMDGWVKQLHQTGEILTRMFEGN